MDDLISRQAAIDVFRQLADDDWNRRTGASWADGYESAIEILEELPSAERKTGRWIHDGYDIPHGVDWIHCSVCGRRKPNVPAARTPYCPNCGADMRGSVNDGANSVSE